MSTNLPPIMTTTSPSTFLSLPAELRLEILSYVFNQDTDTGFRLYDSKPLPKNGLCLDDDYSSAENLQLLRTCRQFSNDFTRLAFANTNFVLNEKYTHVPTRMSILDPFQTSALQYLTLVGDQTQFHDMENWSEYPFNMPDLHLKTLSFAFKSSNINDYSYDFTYAVVYLLRRLHNVERIKFIRNGVNRNAFFKMWCNRFVGLILNEDNFQRYHAPGAPNLPVHWWEWGFDDTEQSFELVATKPMGGMEEGVYLEMAKPIIDKLMKEMEDMDAGQLFKVWNGWG